MILQHHTQPSTVAKWISICLSFFALFFLCVSEVQARVKARSAILMDIDSGDILYSQNADAKIPPASLTKVVSMYVAFDHIKTGKKKLTDKVTISRKAADQPGAGMHIKAKEKVTLDRLLLGMAVSSGNDASLAVAEHIAGSEKKFVALMNKKMRDLNLKKTVFKNPHGLPAKGQFTTAKEMLMVSRAYLKKHPDSLKYHKTRAIKHNGRTTTNKNPLLKSFPGADGLKTGWITASGYNIVSTVKQGKTRLVAVLLGAKTSAIRSREINKLMKAGFEAQKNGTTVASVLIGKPVPAIKKVATATAKKATTKQSSSKKTKSTTSASTKTSTKQKANLTKAKATPVKADANSVALNDPVQTGSLRRL